MQENRKEREDICSYKYKTNQTLFDSQHVIQLSDCTIITTDKTKQKHRRTFLLAQTHVPENNLILPQRFALLHFKHI